MRFKWKKKEANDSDPRPDFHLMLDGRRIGLVAPWKLTPGTWLTYTDLSIDHDEEIDSCEFGTLREAMRALRAYTKVRYVGMSPEERKKWRDQ